MRHTHRFILVVLVTLVAVVATAATVSAQATPSATITQGMPQTTYETSAVFYFSSIPPGSTTFDCKLDYFNPVDQSTEPLYGWSPCTSPKTYTGLTYGRAYAFFVKSQHTPESTAVGNAWSILVPAVTFDSAPAFYWQSGDATLTFHSTPGGVPLECRLVTLSFPDQNIQTVIQDWHGCTSPKTLTGLDSGLIYGLLVKPAGARDEVAAGHVWVVLPPAVVPPAITTESARIAYTGDTQVTTAKVGAKATVTLAATLEEEQDGLLGGHLGGQQIVFGVYGLGDATYANPLAVCTATIGNVSGGKGYGSCNVELGAADPYQVRIGLVDNDYYTAEFETVVVLVNDPGTGFTAGGGWLIDPNMGSRANFGFSARFLKNGRVQGNSLFVYRVTIDLSTILPDAPAGEREYNWIIKSNAMQGLHIYDCDLDTASGCKATITGKNTIQAVDRLTSVPYSIGGNYQFQVDVTDNQEPGASPGAGPDQYAIRVWSTSGTYYELGDTYDDNGMLLGPLDIMGGNIQVKARK